MASWSAIEVYSPPTSPRADDAAVPVAPAAKAEAGLAEEEGSKKEATLLDVRGDVRLALGDTGVLALVEVALLVEPAPRTDQDVALNLEEVVETASSGTERRVVAASVQVGVTSNNSIVIERSGARERKEREKEKGHLGGKHCVRVEVGRREGKCGVCWKVLDGMRASRPANGPLIYLSEQ
jgi:hypothetical protein